MCFKVVQQKHEAFIVNNWGEAALTINNLDKSN